MTPKNMRDLPFIDDERVRPAPNENIEVVPQTTEADNYVGSAPLSAGLAHAN